MKKNLTLAVCTALVLGTGILSGCGTTSGSNGQAQDTTVNTDNQGSTDASSVSESESDETAQTGDNIFSDIAGCTFSFSSGAGAWGTSLNINADGSFSGSYTDSDAGDSGDKYPYGTVYSCQFTGTFTAAEKVNDYTYKTQISSITYEHEEGTEEYLDDIRYIYSKPYGLDDAKDIYIYVKGAAVSSLPEEYVEWVNMALDGADSLPFYGLYNENSQEGFSSYDESDSYDSESGLDANPTADEEAAYKVVDGLKEADEKASEIEKKLNSDADMTQDEMNQLSEDFYNVWDDELNSLWKQLKNTLDSDTMSDITTEQRAWIAEKEQQMTDTGASYDDASLKPFAMNTQGAYMTRARVFELAQYLE